VAAGKRFCGEHAGAAEVWYRPPFPTVGNKVPGRRVLDPGPSPLWQVSASVRWILQLFNFDFSFNFLWRYGGLNSELRARTLSHAPRPCGSDLAGSTSRALSIVSLSSVCKAPALTRLSEWHRVYSHPKLASCAWLVGRGRLAAAVVGVPTFHWLCSVSGTPASECTGKSLVGTFI
jgi:hypothetical protein